MLIAHIILKSREGDQTVTNFITTEVVNTYINI